MHTQSALSLTTIEQILKDKMTRIATINSIILNESKLEKDLC